MSRPSAHPLRATARLLFVLLACAPAAVAHDAFEITTDARVRADGVELKLTLAWSTAMLVVHGGQRPDPWIPPEEFATVRTLLTKGAAHFFRVAGENAEMEPREVEVGLTVENDLEVRLVYPLPPGGGLVFTAALLEILPPEGYGSQFTVLGRDGAFLGQETLWRDSPSFGLNAAALR